MSGRGLARGLGTCTGTKVKAVRVAPVCKMGKGSRGSVPFLSSR